MRILLTVLKNFYKTAVSYAAEKYSESTTHLCALYLKEYIFHREGQV